MPKFEVRVTSTVTIHYLVDADDWEEAEDIVQQGDIKPHHTNYVENLLDTEDIDESP